MSHRTAFSLAGAAVVVCVGYAAWHLLHQSAVQRTDDAYLTADSVLVAPRIPGLVAEVAVDDNQPVKAGQILARLDDNDQRVELASAQANLLAAQAEVRNLGANIERQAALIEQAGATIRASTASLNFAQANAQRYRNLSQAGAGTHEQQQKADAELSNWQAARDRDNAAANATRKTLEVLKAQREAAQANQAKAQAALHQAELNLSYTLITAPVDGVVAQRSVRVGAYVATGRPLLALVPVQQAFVIANFRETQLAHIRPGQAVDIEVDSFPEHAFKGRVDSIAPATGLAFSAIAPDNATGNFTKVVQRLPVKLTLDPAQPDLQALRVGLSVMVTVDTDQADTHTASAPTAVGNQP